MDFAKFERGTRFTVTDEQGAVHTQVEVGIIPGTKYAEIEVQPQLNTNHALEAQFLLGISAEPHEPAKSVYKITDNDVRGIDGDSFVSKVNTLAEHLAQLGIHQYIEGQ